MSTKENKSFDCCPPFDPEIWNDKVFEWKNKKFIKDKVFTLFYMPINFGQVMKRLDKKTSEINAVSPDWMCLSDHTSKWNMDLYLAVEKDVPDCENINMNGKFYCKIYEGSFKNTGKWGEDFEKSAKSNGYEIKKHLMWYTTCPKCVKKYGKNYVAFFGELN